MVPQTAFPPQVRQGGKVCHSQTSQALVTLSEHQPLPPPPAGAAQGKPYLGAGPECTPGWTQDKRAFSTVEFSLSLQLQSADHPDLSKGTSDSTTSANGAGKAMQIYADLLESKMHKANAFVMKFH